MTADIIKFPEPARVNGALAVVADYFERVHAGRLCARTLVSKEEAEAALPDADYFLAWLWEQGFKVVPLDAGE